MQEPLPIIPSSAPFTMEQRAWLNGFLAGLFSNEQAQNGAATSASAPKIPLLVLFGSQTGTAEGLAKKIAVEAEKHDCAARVLDMNAFASIDWKGEKNLLLVTSTWGDGEPPDNAAGFFAFLHTSGASSALTHLSFAVLALGDRNYPSFCGAGRKFDERLEQLGARRVCARAECDLDYEATANLWIASFWQTLSPDAGETSMPSQTVSGILKTEAKKGFDRKNPFPASLLKNRRLNKEGSEKDTRHFEISLDGSGLNYEVGDALGVFPKNSPILVQEILTALRCDGEEAVKGRDAGDILLRKALLEELDIRQIGPALIQEFATRSRNPDLKDLIVPENKRLLDSFLHGREVIDLLLTYPEVSLGPNEFIAALKKLNPRLYSISSSPKAHPGEVHLTVAAVRYHCHGRERHGVCSTFLADRVDAETPLPIFVQTSHGFRLPKNSDTPVIMIGPGTGIAPFRAFIEERRATGASGKNWLFFGDQRSSCDFLYQEELEAWRSDGSLTRLETAFSRDQKEKIYVQHRMTENAAELWDWLEQGAHLYVCGDAGRMAKDVDATLHRIVENVGGRSSDQAIEYVQALKAAKRYQRDVY